MSRMDVLDGVCLVFPFARTNANAISALVASLDTHELLQNLPILFPELNIVPNDLLKQVKPYKRIILAFSVYSTQLPKISKLIEQYRKLFEKKDLLVLCGGPHAIGDPFSMLYNGADIACTGEGELVIREVILAFLRNKSIEQIKGIAYFNAENQLIKTPKQTPINLADFPPFSTKYKMVRPIEITRGCAWKCRFCQIRARGGSNVRHRPIKQILEYVQYTIEHFSERRPDIRFVSPNALSYGSNDGKSLNLTKVRDLLQGIRNIIGDEGKIYFGSFPSEVRPETITDESVALLAEYSNVKKIIIGGQSGSNRILELSDRGHNSEETERAVKLLTGAGFEVDVDIIFGLPDENEEDIQLTIIHIEKLIELGATIHSHTFLPLVGTPFANDTPGVIHPSYRKIIGKLQAQRLLKGQHNKQEEQASEIALRREKEKKIKRIEFKTFHSD